MSRIESSVIGVLVMAMSLAFSGQQRPRSSAASSLTINGVTLIDGSGAAPREGVSLLVRGGRLAEVLAPGAGGGTPTDLVLNARDLVAIPGLIDAHVHISGMPWQQRIDELRRVLYGGVTAIYDLAGDVRNTSDLSRAALVGEIESPTIYYTALMAGPEFFTDPRVLASSAGYKPGDAPWNQQITANTDMVRAVAAARGAGATALKLYAALDAPTVLRISEEAKRQGLRLVAHGTVFPAKPSDLVAAGVSMLAHAAYLVWEGSPPSTEFQKRARGDFAGVPPTSPAIEKLLQSMHDKDVALNPTLWIFAEGSAKDDLAGVRTPWMNAVTHRAQELGVTIAAGTDSMMGAAGDPLPTLHKELEVLVNGAGLTPMQALVAATRGAAHAIGVDADRGTLEVGKVADIVLLDANPLSDIRNTRRIRYVIKDGRIVYQAPTGRSK
jgi:imidazolonepropionase-like amidohydrolase